MSHITEPAQGVSALEDLAGRLDSARFAITLVRSAGRRPHLTVCNRRAVVLTENIYVADGWFWFGWAERIAPVSDLAQAASAVSRVLQLVRD
jgi:hypothetical protein